MKTVNLKSLINIYKANGNMIPNEYANFIGEDYGLNIKNNELNPLVKLIERIEKSDNTLSLTEYNYFYLGYKIPQIGKEFDLLRLDDDNILNIEYKREISDVEKIRKQLLRNKYYLQFLNKNMILIGYVQNIDKLYMLQDDNIIEITDQLFIKILRDNSKSTELNLNNIFKASNYLISPFNKTKQFMEQQYFLTEKQEEIERDIFNCIENGDKNFLIQGDAGTGKTLLTYHIAKKMKSQNKKVALIHCAQLNNGQMELINNYNWDIYPIKSYLNIIHKQYDVLIIDEVQRINSYQLGELRKYANENNIILILSGDRKQILRNGEGGIIEIIEQQQFKHFSMTKKVRTNKELADFISIMLDLTKQHTKMLIKKNINITYFNSYEEANKYISSKRNFSFIPYTSTLYPQYGIVGFEMMDYNRNTVGNPHHVIGQEFENVGVLIDKHFYYHKNKLKAIKMNNNVYSPKDMLYQAITRVIQTLEIIIVDNIEVFNTLIDLFDDK